MAYTWSGMKKLSWEEVQKLHERGELAGCFYLHHDNTETKIESDYVWEDIVRYYENGGEFGCEDKQKTPVVSKEAAVSKLKDELGKAKHKEFAEPVIEYLIKRCEEDNGLCEDVCQEHKTWEKCYLYIYEEARKIAKKEMQCAVRSDVVFEWAEDYFHKDDKAEEEKKAKEEAERKKKEKELKEKVKAKKAGVRADYDTALKSGTDNHKLSKEEIEEQAAKVKKETPKPKKNNKDMEGQIDFFSLLGM